MKIIILFYLITNFGIMSGQIYISEKSNSHFISFLFFSNDSIILENYKIQFKISSSHFVKNVNKYKIISFEDNILITEEDTFYKTTKKITNLNDIFYLESKVKYYGDFLLLDSSFAYISNFEKLNVCRNCYFLIRPTTKIKKRMKKYSKKGIYIKEDIDCRVEHSIFLVNLLKLLK